MTGPIHVVGSINLDLVVTCDSLPRAGETVLGGVYSQHPGGKGANQALAARRLGAEVSMVARVGEDGEADLALALLRQDGVRLDHCFSTASVATGVALIAVAPDGDNQIVVAPGANATLSVSDLPDRMPGALIGQLETPVGVLEAAAARCDGLVVLNLAPARSVPEGLLERADVIVVNQSEAESYGRERLFDAGGLTALTLGAEGALLYRDGEEIARATPPAVDAVDATGAGDTFVAALTVALLEQMAPEEALSFACRAAAASTLRAGAQTSLPYRSTLLSGDFIAG